MERTTTEKEFDQMVRMRIKKQADALISLLENAEIKDRKITRAEFMVMQSGIEQAERLLTFEDFTMINKIIVNCISKTMLLE